MGPSARQTRPQRAGDGDRLQVAREFFVWEDAAAVVGPGVVAHEAQQVVVSEHVVLASRAAAVEGPGGDHQAGLEPAAMDGPVVELKEPFDIVQAITNHPARQAAALDVDQNCLLGSHDLVKTVELGVEDLGDLPRRVVADKFGQSGVLSVRVPGVGPCRASSLAMVELARLPGCPQSTAAAARELFTMAPVVALPGGPRSRGLALCGGQDRRVSRGRGTGSSLARPIGAAVVESTTRVTRPVRHTRCSRDWSSDVCSSDLVRR